MITKLNQFKQILESDENPVEWERLNRFSSMAFVYPPKDGSLTKQLVDFVIANPGKTKKEFYESIGRTLTPGHNSQFFAGIIQSGIVKVEDGKFFLGPNYEAWTKGLLKPKSPYGSNPFGSR
jgi:hypothetical protein